MYPAPFEYTAPTSLDEAIDLLAANAGEAKVLAGGHSLLPLMKLRFAQPAHLVDLRRIPNLSGVREQADALVIGAMTRHAEVAASPPVRRRLPILAEADPGADLPAVMLALDAEMRVVGRRGERTIAAEDFFVDVLTTALEPDEVLTEVRLPVPSGRVG